MSPNEYPVGNVVNLPFAFTTRALTESETASFFANVAATPALALPAATGVDQTNVFFDTAVNDGTPTTQSGAQISHLAVGVYQASVTITKAGTYKCRGYSTDVSGNPVASTAVDVFEGVPFP